MSLKAYQSSGTAVFNRRKDFRTVGSYLGCVFHVRLMSVVGKEIKWTLRAGLAPNNSIPHIKYTSFYLFLSLCCCYPLSLHTPQPNSIITSTGVWKKCLTLFITEIMVKLSGPNGCDKANRRATEMSVKRHLHTSAVRGGLIRHDKWKTPVWVKNGWKT